MWQRLRKWLTGPDKMRHPVPPPVNLASKSQGGFSLELHIPPPNPHPRPGQYDHLWWILDPSHTHHCEDCKRFAANSPYDPPWMKGGNILLTVPGGPETHCGADCTCELSYSPPDPDARVKRSELSDTQRLLKRYTHGQIWYLEAEDMVDELLSMSPRNWPRTVPEWDSPDE